MTAPPPPTAAVLSVASGDGLLVRRERALLYLPHAEGSEELVEAFDSARASTIDAIGDVLMAADLVAPPCAVVDWSGAITIMSFGAVEVRTDHRAVPMISGAGSSTWVEQRLRGIQGSVAVVAGAAAMARSNLLAGAVPSGGFSLALRGASESVVSNDAGVDDDLSIGPAVEHDAAQVEEPPGDQPGRTAPTVLGSAPLSLGAILGPRADEAPVQAADQFGVAPLSGVSEEGDAFARDAATTLIGPNVVEARTCDCGHPNPPEAMKCARCSELLGHDRALMTVDSPVIGSLLFDDESRCELACDLIIGRNPQGSAHLSPLALHGEQLSRQHAVLHCVGWEVFVEDLGSTNGTYVVQPGSTEPVRLDVGERMRLEDGCTLYLGTRSATFIR